MPDPTRHVVSPKCGALTPIPQSQPALQGRRGKRHLLLFQAQPVAADEATFPRHITRNDIPVSVCSGTVGRAHIRGIAHAPDYRVGETQCGTILTAIKARAS